MIYEVATLQEFTKTELIDLIITLEQYIDELEERNKRQFNLQMQNYKYRWHDLRKNPDDLPDMYNRKELWFGGDLFSVGDFCGEYWNADLYRGISEEEYRIPVIAWREIEPLKR